MKPAGIARMLDSVLERTAGGLHDIGGGILAVLMLFTAVDVALRYFFGSPVKGSYEISAFMMAVMIPSGLAFVGYKKGHIRVDVLMTRLPKRVQAGLSVFAYLITLGLVSLMAWQAFKYASLLYQSGATATAIAIPRYPFVIVVAICLTLFALLALRHLIVSINQVVRGAE